MFSGRESLYDTSMYSLRSLPIDLRNLVHDLPENNFEKPPVAVKKSSRNR
jgi:hypothetical protein